MKSIKDIKNSVVHEAEEDSGEYYRNNPPPDSPITRAASNLPVISQVKSIKSAVDNVKQGNYGAAALDIAGEIPKVGAAIGAARAVGNAIKEDKVNDIGELNHEKFGPMLDTFVQFASRRLGIKSMPAMQLQKGEMQAPSFGGYNPQNQSITVISKNRHPMDVFRTVAHELVHHKQKEDGRIGKDISNEGATGSPFENEANAEAGKIMRWFAKKNPEIFKSGYVVEETQLVEGINDPGTFKAVFLAGGPGSGKDYVMKQTLDGMGLQEINSDVAFEYFMRKEGLNFKMPESERVERDAARGRAKNVTKEKERLALSGRRGLIINGTGDDPEKIAMQKKVLEDNGYETMIVFVNTSDKVSKERNESRERSVPEDIRKDKWDACQAAIPVLEKLFGKSNFITIDNSADLRKASPEVVNKVKGEFEKIYKMTRKFISKQPIENQKAKDWMQSEIQRRNMQSFVPAKATSYGTGSVQRGAMQSVAMPVDQNQSGQSTTNKAPTTDELSQAKRLGLTYYGFGRYGKTIKGKNTVTHMSKNGKLEVRQQQQQVAEDLRKWFSKTDPEGGWKRINSKGDAIGPCAREPGEPKPKCMSNEKRASLTKKERAAAVRAKRKYDSNAERKGSPINVSNFGKGKIDENCWKGYEQKGMKKKGSAMVPNCVPMKEANAAAIAAATAIAKKKSGNYDKDGMRIKPYKNPDAANQERRREMKKEEYLLEKNVPTNPALWSRAKSMARSKFDVYPSAYANGWAAKWYKSKGGGWKTQADESFENAIQENTPSDREWGKTSLTNIYKRDTPGQVPDKTFPSYPLFEKLEKKKIIKKAKKKLAQEDNSLALGYEFGNNGIGQEFGVVRSPNGLGMGYSLPMGGAYTMSESVEKWMNKESTQDRFVEKYGVHAERKLYEAAFKLSQIEEARSTKKEAFEALGGRDMGTVAKQGSKEEMPEHSIMTIKSRDYVKKFGKNVTSNPEKSAQYNRERDRKKLVARDYESRHNPDRMVREEVVDIGQKRDEKNIKDFHKKTKGEISDRVSKLSDQIAQHRESGKLPFDVGTRFSTQHTRDRKEPPFRVTGYHVNLKNPDHDYGYHVERDVRGDKEQSMVSIRHPGLEKLHGPEKWAQLQAGIKKFEPLKTVKEENINERGADSKGYYRSTESGAGLTAKGAKHFGIKTAVTTPPSKLKAGSKAAKRRKSFCARMGGMPGPMKDEKGRPTRKAMSLRRWNCEE